MIDLYTWTTPNGRKVSIMLEEAGLAYNVHPVNIREDEQFKPEFLAIAPNNKIPAIVDGDAGGEPVSVFESGAILVHLAEKSGKFLPKDPAGRAKVLEWLFWQMGGVGPMLGQLSHFMNADEKVPYAIDRFIGESLRLFRVMDGQLGKGDYIAGDYSIADMALYPWVSVAFTGLKALKEEEVSAFENLPRWLDRMAARPGVQRGMAIPDV